MSQRGDMARRAFVHSWAFAAAAAAAALAGEGAAGTVRYLMAAADPETPEIPIEIKTLMQQLFGDRPIRRGHVALDMPSVAEDSRVVPLIVDCDLPVTPERYVKAVHLIVDYNPHPYVAGFDLTPELGRFSASTRIKMRRTSWVRAIAETNDGGLWGGYARVRITIDGCA